MHFILILALLLPSFSWSQNLGGPGKIAGGKQSGAQSGVQSGAQGGVQSGAQSGVQSGAQGGVQSGAQGGVQSGEQSGAQSGVQSGTVPPIVRAPPNPELLNEAMSQGCAFMSDNELATQLIPGRATIEALREEARLLKAQATAQQGASNAACQSLGQELGNAIESLARDDDSPSEGQAPGSQPTGSHAERCAADRRANPNEPVKCSCNPLECRNRIQGLITRAQSCGENRRGIVDAITSVALRASVYLGPAASLVGLGLTVINDLRNLFRRSRPASDPVSDATKLLLDRNLACAVNKSWYNTMCPDTQLDEVMGEAPDTPASGEDCQSTPTEAGPRVAIKGVYECLQKKDLSKEQCFACNKVKWQNGSAEIISLEKENQLGTAIGQGATTDISVQRQFLSEMITQARDFHKREAEALMSTIERNYKSASEQRNEVGQRFMAQEYRQLARHCYLGYIPQRIDPARMNVITANSIDRRFNEICGNLNQCIDPRERNGVEMFSNASFEPRGMRTACAAIYQLESADVLHDQVESMRRTLRTNNFGNENGCPTRRWTRPESSPSSSSQ